MKREDSTTFDFCHFKVIWDIIKSPIEINLESFKKTQLSKLTINLLQLYNYTVSKEVAGLRDVKNHKKGENQTREISATTLLNQNRL